MNIPSCSVSRPYATYTAAISAQAVHPADRQPERHIRGDKTMTKKNTTKTHDLPAKQGEEPYEVGPGRPPKEHQFQPGESGNPKGPPKRRTNLWVYFTRYMAMTDAQLTKLIRTKLTAAQQTALNLVQSAKAGEGCGAERLARYVVDREEGKAAEHLVIDKDSDLTNAECEELRELIRENHGSNTDE
jgi:hypothetical protein